MSDIKKYYFLKLKDNYFDSMEIRLLEGMTNGIYYSNLLLKLYLLALKHDGALKLNENIAYDEKMLSKLTNLDMKIVRNGLEALVSLGFVEKLEDGTLYMSCMQSLVGKTNSEADRKKIYRSKIKDSKLSVMSQQCPAENGASEGAFAELSSDKRPPENRETENRDLELRNIEDKERENEGNINSLSVSLLKDFENKTGLTGNINLGALKKAVELHGAENVKMAMDKALEKNKPTMTYINGILKNWAAEGYPKEGEQNGNGGFGKNNGSGSNEFSGFKPKEPRTLTEGERAVVEAELI